MRAVAIDPLNRSVTELDLDGSVESICASLDCAMFQIAHVFETGDTLYVDEDGISRAQDALAGRDGAERAFAFDVDAHQPFYGRGVILGPEDEEGRHTATPPRSCRRQGFRPSPSLLPAP